MKSSLTRRGRKVSAVFTRRRARAKRLGASSAENIKFASAASCGVKGPRRHGGDDDDGTREQARPAGDAVAARGVNANELFFKKSVNEAALSVVRALENMASRPRRGGDVRARVRRTRAAARGGPVEGAREDLAVPPMATVGVLPRASGSTVVGVARGLADARARWWRATSRGFVRRDGASEVRDASDADGGATGGRILIPRGARAAAPRSARSKTAAAATSRASARDASEAAAASGVGRARFARRRPPLVSPSGRARRATRRRWSDDGTIFVVGGSASEPRIL